jgi:hypothetical protein
MVDAVQGGEETPKRLCLCCGAPSALRSISACWDHWSALPEDLRSTIVVSRGRGRLNVYADSLLEAVRLWRASGAWRSKYNKDAAPISYPSAAASPKESQSEHRVISLDQHRQKSAGRALGRSGSANPPAARSAKSQS